MITNKLPHRLVTCLIILSFFASCNSGNKVVSSFGKRKYTKGFYLNLPSRTTTIAKHQSESKPHTTTINPIIENTAPASSSQFSDNANEQLNIKQDKPINNLQAAQKDFPDTFKVKKGTPAHIHVYVNNDAQQRSDELDSDANAKWGFIWGLVAELTVILGIGFVFGIIGIVMSIKGLNSKENHAKALIGLILSILAIISFFVLLVLAFAALAAM